MEKPCFKIILYEASTSAYEILEGTLSENLPKEQQERELELIRRGKADTLVERAIINDHFNDFNSIFQNYQQAERVGNFVLSTLEHSKKMRDLIGVGHGRLSWYEYLLIPEFDKKTENKLINILLEAPYQPKISNKVYVGAKVLDNIVDEKKEHRKLWRNALKFIKE